MRKRTIGAVIGAAVLATGLLTGVALAGGGGDAGDHNATGPDANKAVTRPRSPRPVGRRQARSGATVPTARSGKWKSHKATARPSTSASTPTSISSSSSTTTKLANTTKPVSTTKPARTPKPADFRHQRRVNEGLHHGDLIRWSTQMFGSQ